MGQIHHLGRASATAEVGMALGRPLARRDAVSGRTVAGRALGRHATGSGAARVARGGVGRDSGHGASKFSGDILTNFFPALLFFSLFRL